MADNVAITAGTGTAIAADDITSVFYQRVKLSLGADGSAVDAIAGNGVSGTGVQRVTIASDSTGVVGLNAGTAAIGKVKVTNDAGTVIDPVAAGTAAMAASVPVTIATDDTQFAALLAFGKVDDAAFTPATSKVWPAAFLADEASTDSVDEGDAGIGRMTLDRKQIVTVQPHTAGGLTIFRSLDLDETEEEVKATAGCLYKLRASNFATTTRYLKLYNATAANTTVGTTTPIDTIIIPPGSSTNPTILTESFGGIGVTFDTALSAAVTTALADNDTGAPGASEVVVTAYYK